jgi:hypothetical protein
MANNTENPSNLSTISEQFRKDNLVKNSCRYVDGKPYDATSPDVFSDGDCRGRDPIDASQASSPVGTNFDIACRDKQLSCIPPTGVRYTKAKPYGEGNC